MIKIEYTKITSHKTVKSPQIVAKNAVFARLPRRQTPSRAIQTTIDTGRSQAGDKVAFMPERHADSNPAPRSRTRRAAVKPAGGASTTRSAEGSSAGRRARLNPFAKSI
jgi:hypothetical protein